MKIYYPTHTRLDGLSIGVLIGYLMQYSSDLKMGSSERKYDLSGGMLLLGISFWVCDDQASERASLFGFTIVAGAGNDGCRRFQNHHFFINEVLYNLTAGSSILCCLPFTQRNYSYDSGCAWSVLIFRHRVISVWFLFAGLYYRWNFVSAFA
jgi:hypothetical protein